MKKSSIAAQTPTRHLWEEEPTPRKAIPSGLAWRVVQKRAQTSQRNVHILLITERLSFDGAKNETFK